MAPSDSANGSLRRFCVNAATAGIDNTRNNTPGPAWRRRLPMTTAAVSTATAAGTARSRAKRRAPDACDETSGRARQASTSTSGYSTMPVNKSGAASVLNKPPIRPPSEIQK